MTRFTYSHWRHGGWYVHEVHYASGAIGCVSRNFPDGKWRIVCDRRPFEDQPTFATRDEAAAAEFEYARSPEIVRADLANLRKSRQAYIDRGADPQSPVILDRDKRIAEAVATLEEDVAGAALPTP